MENTLDLNVSRETKASDVSDYLNKTKFQYAFSSGSNVVLAFHFENEMICIKIHKEDIDFVFVSHIYLFFSVLYIALLLYMRSLYPYY